MHRYFSKRSVSEHLERAGFEVVEQRYILASDFAREQLTRDLHQKRVPGVERNRRRRYAQLAEAEEALPDPDTGIMILFRARKARGRSPV